MLCKWADRQQGGRFEQASTEDADRGGREGALSHKALSGSLNHPGIEEGSGASKKLLARRRAGA